MRIIGIAVVLALAPVAFGQLVDMTIDSSTAGAHEYIDQYLDDEILGIEVAQKDGWTGWLYWDVPTFNFGPINLAGVSGEVQLYDRYHQEDYPDRPAYSDCNVWLLLEDVNGELADLGWSAEHWTADSLVEYLSDPDAVVKNNPRLAYKAEKYAIAMPAVSGKAPGYGDKANPEALAAIAQYMLVDPP